MRMRVTLLVLALAAAPAAAQTPAQVDSAQVDSLLADLVDGRKDAVSSRGFIRASETQLTKIVDRLDALIARARALLERLGSPPDTVPPDTVPPAEPPDTTPEPPDTVPEEPDEPEPPAEPEPGAWATGRWIVSAQGQSFILDFAASRLELPVGTVPADVTVDGETAHITFTLPGYGQGTLTLTHSAGGASGTVSAAGQTYSVTAERVFVPRPAIDMDTVPPAPRLGMRYDSTRVVVPSGELDARGTLVLAPGESVTVCAVGWSAGRIYLMPGEDVSAYSFDDSIVSIEYAPGFPADCLRYGRGPAPFSHFLAIRVE